MLHSVQNTIGFTLGATDGEIGKVKDLYFDDKSWDVRYLVVETGVWLFGRKVLLSPVAVEAPDWEKKIFPVNLTRNQIRQSPDLSTDIPVSRQHEIELHNHYGWPYYGGASGMGFMTTGMVGGVIAPGVPIEERIADEEVLAKGASTEAKGDPHLRSCKTILDYAIHATDGDLGDVDDFLMDSSTWKVPYLVSDTGIFYSGKKLIIATKEIKNIEWESSGVYVSKSKDSFNDAPEFNTEEAIGQELERELLNYYQSR